MHVDIREQLAGIGSSQPACGTRGSNLVNTILLAVLLTAFSKKLLERNRVRVGVVSFIHFPGWHLGTPIWRSAPGLLGQKTHPGLRDLERILWQMTAPQNSNPMAHHGKSQTTTWISFISRILRPGQDLEEWCVLFSYSFSGCTMRDYRGCSLVFSDGTSWRLYFACDISVSGFQGT